MEKKRKYQKREDTKNRKGRESLEKENQALFSGHKRRLFWPKSFQDLSLAILAFEQMSVINGLKGSEGM